MRTFIILLLLLPSALTAQVAEAGPVIKDFGKVYRVDQPTYQTNMESEFKVVFDVLDSPEEEDKRNRKLETAARFLNMHVQAGKDRDLLKVAVVVHGTAATDLLDNEAHSKRFGTPNPNRDLLQALMDEGVEIILCGQSANSRDIDPNTLIPGVKLALSAMTALIQMQQSGYQLIKF